MAVNLILCWFSNIRCNLLKPFSLFQRLMPLVLKELASSSETNRRNAAFCAGELAKNGGESTLKYPFPAHALTHSSFLPMFPCSEMCFHCVVQICGDFLHYCLQTTFNIKIDQLLCHCFTFSPHFSMHCCSFFHSSIIDITMIYYMAFTHYLGNPSQMMLSGIMQLVLLQG